MASLAPKTDVLGYHNAAHLLRRATYRITKSMINAYALKTPQQALDDLFVFTAPNSPSPLTSGGQTYLPTVATPVTQSNANFINSNFFNPWWVYGAITSPNLEYKLAQWLHLMFPVSTGGGQHWNRFDYLQLIRFHSNKSIKELAIRVTKDVRMLQYLNNDLNHKNNPNQNYAREFLELFTILKGEQVGQGDYTNYTEHDLQQAARVFTGFTTNTNVLSRTGRLTNIDPVTQLPTGIISTSAHDIGNKTFSHAFNNAVITGATTEAGIQAEMENFVTMVFNQPATAKNYCRRLYRYFVGRNITQEIETDIINPLADTMMANNYNIVPVVKQLLTSKHFYDEDDTISGDEVLGALVKSPIDLLLQLYTIFDIAIPIYSTNPSSIFSFVTAVIIRVSSDASLNIHNPETVNGYTGYTDSPHYDKNWITTATLKTRYSYSIDNLINGLSYNGHMYKLDTPNFVKNSGHFSNPANAVILMQEFYDLLFVATPQGERHTYFYNFLLGGLSTINWQMEWNNYEATNNATSVKIALDKLVRAMIKSPEYQVM